MTPARLRELLHYDAATGIFTRLTRASRRTRIGAIAGAINDQGYIGINLDGRSYKAHRLAWLYMHGAWPTSFIDHVNGNRADNRICNLREATRSQNLGNSRVARSGRDLPKGVTRRDGRFVARIQAQNRSVFLGYFNSADAAADAYRNAATTLFGQFARTL